jgi:predicted glycogen debranching enzyme
MHQTGFTMWNTVKKKNEVMNFLKICLYPGILNFPLKKGESIVLSGSLAESEPNGLKQKFTAELNKRIPRDNFENCLINSAQQFIVKRNKKTQVVAGFPWFGVWGRDTFIALPGLTLAIGDKKTAKEIFDTSSKELKKGLFRNMGGHHDEDYNSVDAPLWYIWALQQYASSTKDYKGIWKDYGSKISSILDNYKKGTDFNISMHENGLIYAGQTGYAPYLDGCNCQWHSCYPKNWIQC